jgi:hypothetical protein
MIGIVSIILNWNLWVLKISDLNSSSSSVDLQEICEVLKVLIQVIWFLEISKEFRLLIGNFLGCSFFCFFGFLLVIAFLSILLAFSLDISAFLSSLGSNFFASTLLEQVFSEVLDGIVWLLLVSLRKSTGQDQGDMVLTEVFNIRVVCTKEAI